MWYGHVATTDCDLPAPSAALRVGAACGRACGALPY
jgi:hypothetical protein